MNIKHAFDRKKVYYTASPYTALGKTGREAEDLEALRYFVITDVIARLTLLHGITLLGPITTSHNLKLAQPELGTTWDFWKTIDENFMRVSDVLLVVMMEGWAQSIGVKAEIELAKKFHKEIIYMNPVTLELVDTYELRGN
jgi:hypothetical protein